MTTVHSLMRAKKRLGYNTKSAEHFIQNAIERGKTVNNFRPGKEREWLEQRCSDGYQVIVYNGCCLILNEQQVCITLYSVPHWFGKQIRYDGKESIRNIVKYQKYNAWERVSYSC